MTDPGSLQALVALTFIAALPVAVCMVTYRWWRSSSGMAGCAIASATLARRARRSWAERPASRVAYRVVKELWLPPRLGEISQAYIFISRVGEAHAPLGLACLGYRPV